MNRRPAQLTRSVLRRLVVFGALLALLGAAGSSGCKDALDKIEKSSDWIIEPAPEPAAAAQFQLAEPYYVENQGDQPAAPATAPATAPSAGAPAVAGAPVAAAGRLAPVAGTSVDTHVRVPGTGSLGAKTDGYVNAPPSAAPAAPAAPAPVAAAPSAPSDDTWRPGPTGVGPSLPAPIPQAPKAVALGPLPPGKAGIDEAIRRLKGVMKISPRVTASTQVPNAAATVGHVIYNPNFFQQVRRKGGDSAVVGILAHEFGHISKRHVFRHQGDSSSSRSKELEADSEAGCALAKLGMSAHGYVRVTTTLAGVGSYSHPGGAQRKHAIERGFGRCGGTGNTLVAEAPTGRGDTVEQSDGDDEQPVRRSRRGRRGGYGGGFPGGGYGDDGQFGGPTAGYPGRNGGFRGQGGYPGGGGFPGGGYPGNGGYGGGYGGGFPGGGFPGGGYGAPGGGFGG